METDQPEQLSAARLTIRLGALKRNYLQITERAAGCVVGAAVKANGYGLGAVEVSGALYDVGCRDFFVAYLAEAIEVRQTLPDANIYVFNGAMPGTVDDLVSYRLIPLVLSLEQLALWQAQSRRLNQILDVGLHFDTGMGRTGIPSLEAEKLFADPSLLDGLDLLHVMSHLATADEPASEMASTQLQRFTAIRSRFPGVAASFSNSGGVFQGPDYHFDMVRPGIALYGGTPVEGMANPMEPTVVLDAPIIQFKDVAVGERVGYGATYEVNRPERHATVTVGYADGYLRSSSNSGQVSVRGFTCPIVGRVSMDLTIIDVTDVPDELLYLGAPVEMIGHNRPINEVANDAGTIANELLTELGSRYDVVYTND